MASHPAPGVCGDLSPDRRACQLLAGHGGVHLARVAHGSDAMERWGEPVVSETDDWEPPEPVVPTGPDD